MHAIWMTVFYNPLYNLLIGLTSIIPGHDVGIALIALTILVKIALFPIARKSIRSQVALKNLEPEIKKIKENYPDKQEQAKRTFELYKINKVNPFSGCILILIQLPIIFALYFVFLKGLHPGGPRENLYSFTPSPGAFNLMFLGILDLAAKSKVLALLAGLSQFFQVRIATPSTLPPKDPSKKETFGENLARSMNIQMRYILPVFIAFVAYNVSAAIALYWTASNVVAIIQEILVRRKLKHSNTITVKAYEQPKN